MKIELSISALLQTHSINKIVSRFENDGEFPSNFPYRARCIFAFEELDGVEVCFFGMHVQEYSDDCPQPNAKYD